MIESDAKRYNNFSQVAKIRSVSPGDSLFLSERVESCMRQQILTPCLFDQIAMSFELDLGQLIVRFPEKPCWQHQSAMSINMSKRKYYLYRRDRVSKR